MSVILKMFKHVKHTHKVFEQDIYIQILLDDDGGNNFN